MKKIKLLLAAMAAMVCSMANATEWTGSAVAAGKYYLYNVGARQFLGYGGSWGTQAVIDATGIPVTLVANSSAYQIKTEVTGTSGNIYLGADFYIDQAACDYTFTAVDGKTNVYTISYSDGGVTKYRMIANNAKTFDKVSSVAAGSNWSLESLYWMLITEDERNQKLADKDATTSQPLDLTYKIANPNTAFYTGCYTTENPWTVGVEGSGWGNGGRDNGSAWRNKCFEVWNKNFNNYMTFSDMPKGIYQFSVTGFYRDGQYASGNNVQNAYIYANAQQVALQPILNGASSTQLCSVYTGNDAWQNDATIDVNNSTVYYPNSQGGACFYFQAGKYAEQTVEVELESAGTLTIGVKKETTVNGDWTVVDKFQLFYLGDPDNPAPYKVERDNLIASLSTLNGTIPTACINAINSVVADNDDDYSTIAEYQTAIANINNAVSTYASAAIVNAYSAYNTIKTAALALDDDATIFTGDARVNATTADTEVEAATTVAGINDAIGTLRAAASSFLGAVTVNDGKSFDITNVFITNPAPWASTDGWNCPVAATPNSSARAAEFWNKSGVSITQEMASLPAGYYTLKAQAFARTGCSPIYIFAGAADTDSSDPNIQELIKKSNSEIWDMNGAGSWFDGGNGWNTFTYQNETAGSFTIGLKDEFVPNGSHGDGNDGWLIWREFGLLYLGTEPVSVLADLYADAKAAAEAARDNTTYANVAGAERAALLAAIADTPEATAESYKAKTSALIVATNSFIDDGVVLAWNNYATAFANEVTKATALGLTSEQANSYAATSATTASGTTACIQNLKVAEYNFVTTNYSHAVTLGTWNASEGTGTMTSQHWDGTGQGGSEYLEQSGANYGNSSWDISYDQDITLPAGNYVFKVAGRTANTNNVTMALTVKNGETVLGTVNDFPKGDVGLGINTSGETDYTTGEGHTYANNGNGRGWEWRYVKFTLAEPATVNVAVTASATAKSQWVGFCNATVQTDDADNVAIMEALVALNDAKAAATLTRRTANVGTGVFQIDATTEGSLWTAYSTAKSNAEAFALAANTEVEDVTALTTALTTAQTNYTNNNVLVAPDASKRYVLTIVEDGKDWNGNAVTFMAGAREDMGGYGIKYLTSTNANMNQALKFTAVDGETNTYKVSAINVADGGERYITTGTTYPDVEGNSNAQIRTTDEASKASWVKIQATETNGQFQLLNVSDGNKVIANNNNNDMYTANTANFTIAEASQAEVAVNVAADKYATRIFPFAPGAIDGITFYSCEAAENGELTLVEVATPAANVPYILLASKAVSTTLTGWGTASDTEYTAGWLTGEFAAKEITDGYVLQTLNEEQKFYAVDSSDPITVPAYRAYLTVSGGNNVKAFSFPGTMTAVEAIEAARQNGAIFNLAGQRVNKAQRGLYIVNGKKVIVK